MDQIKFFKGCLPQIFTVPFLNTSTKMSTGTSTASKELFWTSSNPIQSRDTDP